MQVLAQLAQLFPVGFKCFAQLFVHLASEMGSAFCSALRLDFDILTRGADNDICTLPGAW